MTISGIERSTAIAAFANPVVGRKFGDIIDLTTDGVMRVSFSVGAEAANAIAVTITVLGASGLPLTNPVVLDVYLLSSAAGTAFTAASGYTLAATTGAIRTVVTDAIASVITNSSGVAVITLTNVGAVTSFVGVRLLGGKLAISPTVTHV